MKLTIGSNAIELDGLGTGVTIKEIKRIQAEFRKLFKVNPRIRAIGVFGPDALVLAEGGDAYVTAWDLRKAGGGYAEVLSVGKETLSVDLLAGLNNGKPLLVRPELGAGVKIRFMLPST